MKIVDLTLPVETGMAGIPKMAFYEKFPVKVDAVTVVNEDQRALLARERVDTRDGAEAINTMNTVLTLNTHIGTHIEQSMQWSGSMARKLGPSWKQVIGQTSTQSVWRHWMQASVTTKVMDKRGTTRGTTRGMTVKTASS